MSKVRPGTLSLILLLFAIYSNATDFPETCTKTADVDEVIPFSNRNRQQLDWHLILSQTESDGVKMMKSFSRFLMSTMNAFSDNFRGWDENANVLKELETGLREVCNIYDSEYKNAFPYSCYSKENWCSVLELVRELLKQAATVWEHGQSKLRLGAPWLSFFEWPETSWQTTYVSEMKMAAEMFFSHPSLGSMTEPVKEGKEALKDRVLERITYYVRTNQHENLNGFMERFGWVKEPFVQGCRDTEVEFLCQVSRVLVNTEAMLKDTGSFEWDFSPPVPRNREVVAMLWLVLPFSTRELFPSPDGDAVAAERVKRFFQLTFNHVYEGEWSDVEALEKGTETLRARTQADCQSQLHKEVKGLECDVAAILDRVNKFVETAKRESWDSGNARNFKSTILISLSATRVRQYIELTSSHIKDILTETFERFYSYAKANDVEGLGNYMNTMPSSEMLQAGGGQTCSEFVTDLKEKLPCIVKNVFGEVYLYLSSFDVSPLKTKVLNDFSYVELLRSSQLSSIANQIDQQTIEFKADFAEFAKEIKDYVSEDSSRRFAALEEYFNGLADFDKEKALADVGFIAGRLKGFDDAVAALQPSVEEKLTVIIKGSLTANVADVIQRTAELVVKTIFAFRPDDPDPGAAIDAANDLAESLVNAMRSTKLKNSFGKVVKQTNSIAARFGENKEFMDNVKAIVDTLPSQLDNTAEFDDKTKLFLDKYVAYDPKVQRQELTKVGTDWETYIGEACELLFAGGTVVSSLVKEKFVHEGQCLTTQGEISELMEIFSEIYEYQFEMMETLATAVRAYHSKFYATKLNTKLRVLSDQALDDERDEQIVNLRASILNLFLVSRLHTLQIIAQHCNFLEFKNAGEMPSVCASATRSLESRDIAKLIGFQPARCNPRIHKYVDIPTAKPAGEGKEQAWINVTRLYAGDEIPFRIPDTDWLVENNWITRSAARNRAFYISNFELFLFSEEGDKKADRRGQMKRVMAKVRAQRSSSTSTEIRFRIAAKYPAKLFMEDGATRYAIKPHRNFVFSYKEKWESCRQDPTINPYSSALPKICLTSLEPEGFDLDPSVFSLWKVKLETETAKSPPENAADMKLKAGIKLCEIQKPSTVSRRKKKKAAKEE